MYNEYQIYFEKFHVITDYLIPIRRWATREGKKPVYDLQVECYKNHVFLNEQLSKKYIGILLDQIKK